MIMGDDEVPEEMIEIDPWGGRIMQRIDGWCAALDRNTMQCRIYERRPAVCRDYQVGGSECIAERSAAKL
jgi:Fe-S-cluster containining protein